MPGTKRKKKAKKPKRPEPPIKIQNIPTNDNKDEIKYFLTNFFSCEEELDWNKDPIDWLNKKDILGNYPLFVACQLLDPIAEDIFDIYPDAVTLEQQWSKFTNPCHITCRFSNHVPRLRLIKKQNPNLIHDIDEYGRTPLFYTQTKRFKWFIREAKVDVNVKDNKGQTAFHYNVDTCNYDYCDEFLDKFTKVFTKGNDLHNNFTKGNDLDNNGDSPFFSLIKNLLDESTHYNRNDNSRLSWFIHHLLKYYPDAINRPFSNNENMLHYVCRNFNKNETLSDYIKGDMIDNLVCFINQADNSGMTPLHLACFYDHDCIRFLLKQRNVMINKKDNSEKTALHHACEQHNCIAFMYLTESKSIDIESVDVLENTALHSLMCDMEKVNNKSESMVKFLLYKSPYMIYKLNKQNFTAMDIMKNKTCTPTMSNIDIVHKICNTLNNAFNIMINKQNADGNTPLHLLCKRSSLNECHVVSKILTDPNILVNVKNNKGRTPFHGACYHCNPCMVNQLNEHPKINIHKVDNNGENALHHLLQGYFKHQDNEACKLTIELLLRINPFFVIKENKHGETPLYYITKFNRNNIYPDLHLNGKWRRYISPESNREVWKFLLLTIQNCHLEALFRIKNYLMQHNLV